MTLKLTAQRRTVPAKGSPIKSGAVSMIDEIAELRRQRDEARKALEPFAAEGRKWLGTNPSHDDLRLCVAEDWHLVGSLARVAEFSVGDLKRAASLGEPISP